MPVVVFGLLMMAISAWPAQNPVPGVRAYRLAHENDILREFAAWLAVPNMYSDRANIRRNAELLAESLRRRKVDVQILETQGGPPIVFGELRAPGAAKTLLLYAHYDGQPVTAEGWKSDPWKPVLRDGPFESGGKDVPLETAAGKANGEWRLYARGASDDKGTMMAALAALDALAAEQKSLSVNLKFLFEGEEETGSPHLGAFLDQYKTLLRADALLLCDGPVHQSRRMQITFGARGITDLEITVYGPSRALHSGHYGNWAPNPASLLANLIASLRDPEGKILVPGFYDGLIPLTASERAAIDKAPRVDDALRRELALGWSEGGNTRIEDSILLPALNVRGLRSGAVREEAQNAVPMQAAASLDFRLVPGLAPARVRELVERYLEKLGYHIVRNVPDAETRLKNPKVIRLEWGTGYPAFRTAMDLPFSRALLATMGEAAGPDLVALPLLGGSIPMYLFAEKLSLPVVLFPIANHDNYQHGPNENIRLQNLWDGIEYYAALYTRLSSFWK
jgi:acetylornithine deacetylase/succinyl-diaminopimelate desuccinylase-like protein